MGLPQRWMRREVPSDMNICVLLKRSPDVRVPLERETGSGRIDPDRQVAQLDAAAAAAWETGLGLAYPPSGGLTAITLGPADEETVLREALATGASRAIRIWEESPEGWESGLDKTRTYGKSVVLAEACRVLGFDVLLAGTCSADSAGGQLAAAMAARLGVTFVGQVLSARREESRPGHKLSVVRALAHGYQEVVEAECPVILAVLPRTVLPRFPTYPEMLAAEAASIEVWDLAELGVPATSVKEADRMVVPGPLRFPKPRGRVNPAPDSALPAFNRIQLLVQGTVSRREGSLSTSAAERAARELFERLSREGWLDHVEPHEAPGA